MNHRFDVGDLIEVPNGLFGSEFGFISQVGFCREVNSTEYVMQTADGRKRCLYESFLKQDNWNIKILAKAKR